MKAFNLFLTSIKQDCKLMSILMSIIALFLVLPVAAQVGTLTFQSATSPVNLGTTVYDNKTYSTDIPSIEIKIFNASNEANAAARVSAGSFIYASDVPDGANYPAIFAINNTSGVTDDSFDRPKYTVIASTNGAEFGFRSLYVEDFSLGEPMIKFEGFRNGVSTGSVIVQFDQNLNEWQKTFGSAFFPMDKFGNVDEVRISNATGVGVGNTVGFNNFVFAAPVATSTTVSTTALGVSSAANSTASFTITSNTSWTVSSNQTWLTVSPISGSNNATVVVTAEANPSTSSRTATVSVSGANPITVTQASASAMLTLSTTSINVAAVANNSASFSVTSNTSWAVSSNQTWLTVSPTSGSNNGTISISVLANPMALARTATISVSGVSNPQTITVTQAAASPLLSVSSSNLSVASAEGSTASFFIDSNTSWNLSSNQNWLSASAVSGIGNNQIILTAASNTTSTARTAEITVSATGIASKIISVTQGAGTTVFSISSKDLVIAATGGSSATFSITANVAWSISPSISPWVNVTPSSGSGNALITISVLANPETAQRTATLNVYQVGISTPTIINITQQGIPKTLTISNPSLTIAGSNNSTANISISSNTGWDISCNESWLTFSPSGGIGNSSIRFNAESNPTIYPRTAVVTVSSVGMPNQTINVTQQAGAATLSLSKTSLSIGASEGSSASFDITSNSGWTISSSHAWLTFSPISGSNNSTVTLFAAANSIATTRTATVTISASGVANQTLSVTQDAGIVTGLTSTTDSNFILYPNPTTHGFYIELGDNLTSVTIIDLTGKIVLSLKASNRTYIDVSILPVGVYIVKTDKGLQKLVITKHD